jgi:hypothetical protein
LQGIAVASEAETAVRGVAVGGGYDRVAGTEVPIIWHWTGSAWTECDDLEGAHGYVLTDVAMFPDGRAWAVGHGFPWGRPAGPVALLLSECGWRHAALPEVPRGKLLAVAGTAADDVWAVGAADRAGLIMHYDGRSWTRVPSPSTRFPLTDVEAVAPDDVWAVGRDRVLHWNGRRWRRVKAPVTAANTVTASAPDDVWVAGGRGELACFDGRRWTVESSPHPLGETAVWLASASFPGSDAVWMVGSHSVTLSEVLVTRV